MSVRAGLEGPLPTYLNSVLMLHVPLNDRSQFVWSTVDHLVYRHELRL